ncbi:hypothetical protein ACLOJK_034215 [Asimina triloba]
MDRRSPPMASTFIEHQRSSLYQRVRLQAGTPGSHIVQHDPSMASGSDPNRDGVKPISSNKAMASPSRLNPAMIPSMMDSNLPSEISSPASDSNRGHARSPPLVITMDESITIHQWLDPAIFVSPPDQLRQWQITEPIQDPGASIGSRLADLHGS